MPGLQTHLAEAGKWPAEVMKWAGALASHSLDPIAEGQFQLTEHDYCVDDRKIGGNAQCESIPDRSHGKNRASIRADPLFRGLLCVDRSSYKGEMGTPHVMAVGL